MFSQSARPATDPLQVLQSALKGAVAPRPAKPRLLMAGAGGILGNEVLRRLAGSGGFAHVELLVCEPMTVAVSRVSLAQVSGSVESWPVRPVPVQTGLVMFEPPRLYHERERALWTPAPEQLLALARWFRRCGVTTLVVVTPHAQGRLPEALKRGLANMDEQALTGLGFERLLLVRAARKAAPGGASGLLEKTAAWMLSIFNYMIPASEQPVRPVRLAEFIDEALQVLPPGNHVAPPELLALAPGQAGMSSMKDVVRHWLQADLAVSPGPTAAVPPAGNRP